METILPWVISATTLWTLWLTGNKYKYVWVVIFLNQFLWLYSVYLTKQVGLLPLILVVLIVSVRNHFIWVRE